MSGIIDSTDKFVLNDGAKIAVIGGGPTGAFFSIFALKMARMIDKDLSVTIFEPKDFTKDGPGGCNRCGGIISELLVQTLAVEGINLPDAVVRKGINSYILHTSCGDVSIATPDSEKTIATVYRGGGPKGMIANDMESFDQFLLSQAVKEGAVHKPVRIDKIEYRGDKPVLFSRDSELIEADLVVGAFGVNSTAARIFEDIGFGYKEPTTVTAGIVEMHMGGDIVSKYFGNSIHLFLLPDKNLKFAAMIPKGPYVTLCILGKGLTTDIVNDFINKPIVQNVLPKNHPYTIACRCLPKMNVRAPKKPFTNRIVMCGDAGSTRLFKDGLGAAYLMGKAAAKTAIFDGVGNDQFQKNYSPVYKSIIHDNYFGSFMYTVIDVYRSVSLMTQAMLKVVEKEQASPEREKILSSILWDMFTGNARYKNVFFKSLKVKMHLDMWEGVFKSLGGRKK